MGEIQKKSEGGEKHEENLHKRERWLVPQSVYERVQDTG